MYHLSQDGVKRWEPLRQVPITRDVERLHAAFSGDAGLIEIWLNDEYEVMVYAISDRGKAGWLWLSLKQLTREVVRDWRHLQSIKNEVCGWGREALELFPAEERLVDGANQTHLWVMPAGERFPLGFNEGRHVGDQAKMADSVSKLGLDPSKGRQRPWQPGLSTGPNYRPKGAGWS